MVDFGLSDNHLCRDFLTQPNSQVPATTMYVLSIFMRHVLEFGVVGHTNFDLLGTYLLSSSISASINQGLGEEYVVSFPTSSYVVTTNDVDRILALRSVDNPRHNSGLFRITSVNTGSNNVTIDYRTSEFPPIEIDIPFAIFESENIVSSSWLSGSNGNVGYNSNGDATASRIIFRSNETLSAYQVRLALESSVDINGSSVVPFSIAPGFFGNNAGDFEYKSHLHGGIWHDTTSSLYRGLTVGAGHSVSTIPTIDQWRVNFIGNKTKGTVGYMIRSGSTISTHWGCFGVSEDEPEDGILVRYTGDEHIFRLFSLGSSQQTPAGSWRFDYQDRGVMNGVAWGMSTEEPVTCVASTYFPAAFTSTSDQTTELHLLASTLGVTSSSWTGGVELSDVELLVGTFDSSHDFSTGPLWELQPRRLGRLPFFRQGSTIIGDWVGGIGGHFLSSSWIHSTNGIYMEWGGPFPTDMTQGLPVTLLEATTMTSSTGLLLLDPIDPGDEPTSEEIEFVKDLDAVRYRKTYSYYRQEPRLVDFVKGGSNPNGGSR